MDEAADVLGRYQVAWRPILLNGHDTFHSDGKLIDPDAIVADLNRR